MPSLLTKACLKCGKKLEEAMLWLTLACARQWDRSWKGRGPCSFMRQPDFRNFILNKRVCLVANSGALQGSSLGPWIDGHDLVVRFNSFALIPADTGTKTDVHAAIHHHAFNLDVPVALRLIFSGNHRKWRNRILSVAGNGNQAYLGGPELRWPIKSKVFINDSLTTKVPTTGFHVMRMCHYFGCCKELNLIGFDFYDSGILRLQEAENLPIATTHNYDAERLWVEAHTLRKEGIVIFLDPSNSIE